MARKDTSAKTFWSRVDIRGEDECWPWLGHLKDGKYGQTPQPIGGERYAHRVAYGLAIGTIPEGLGVLHHCDNPPCCNPKHLYAGTHADNAKDMVSRKRVCRTVRTWLPGSANGAAKLTEDIVCEIIKLYASGSHTQKELAVKFGVTQPRISLIVRGKAWRHLK